jgi:hypothetical protein
MIELQEMAIRLSRQTQHFSFCIILGRIAASRAALESKPGAIASSKNLGGDAMALRIGCSGQVSGHKPPSFFTASLGNPSGVFVQKGSLRTLPAADVLANGTDQVNLANWRLKRR